MQTPTDQPNPDQPKPDPTTTDPTTTDPTKPDPTKPDPTKPDPTKPDQTPPDKTTPDQTTPDPPTPDPPTPEETWRKVALWIAGLNAGSQTVVQAGLIFEAWRNGEEITFQDEGMNAFINIMAAGGFGGRFAGQPVSFEPLNRAHRHFHLATRISSKAPPAARP